uniref:Uncharacterized protein n=1 Tax=Cucumis melo TaxID=3656 RepID=A0A9I9EKI2_CUCME
MDRPIRIRRAVRASNNTSRASSKSRLAAAAAVQKFGLPQSEYQPHDEPKLSIKHPNLKKEPKEHYEGSNQIDSRQQSSRFGHYHSTFVLQHPLMSREISHTLFILLQLIDDFLNHEPFSTSSLITAISNRAGVTNELSAPLEVPEIMHLQLYSPTPYQPRRNKVKEEAENISNGFVANLKFAAITTKTHLGINIFLQDLQFVDNFRNHGGNRRGGAPTLPFLQGDRSFRWFRGGGVAVGVSGDGTHLGFD